MMTLRVRSEPCVDNPSPSCIDVHWRTGATKSGVVRVTVVPKLSDPAVAAELGAVHWLLTEKNVLGEGRTGNGLKIVFSRGAVKKLLRKDSDKFDLAVYARYLMTRFEKAKLEVDKDPIEHAPDPARDEILLDEPARTMVLSPRMGWVEITAHAIEQYVERSNSGAVNNAYASLARRLENPMLQKVDVPERVLRHKRIKHQTDQEIWRHPDDTTHYTLVPRDDGTKVLVTVYQYSER